MKANVFELAMMVQEIFLYGEVDLSVERFELERQQLSLLLFQRDLMLDCIGRSFIEVVDQLDFAVLEVWLAIDCKREINVGGVPIAGVLHVSAHVALDKAPRAEYLTCRCLTGELALLRALGLTASFRWRSNLTYFLI